MSAQNGYDSILSYNLGGPGGDHVGTADGWSYFTTGGLGYVFEIGPSSSHPAYADVIAHYDGTYSGAGGNREAYYIATESTANAARHAVIDGTAPPGAILRLTKPFNNRTAVAGLTTEEHFESTMRVPASGRFEWHVNQSGRPLFPSETWTLRCELPEGTSHSAQQVAVRRGQTATVDLCASPPAPVGPSPEPTAGLVARLRASFGGRRYRVRVTGTLANVDPGPGAERCAGSVVVRLLARSRLVRRRRATMDATCAFEHVFRFRPRALQKGLRKRKTGFRLKAVARFTGNDAVQPLHDQATGRVRRR
jgi:hypothetical protein